MTKQAAEQPQLKRWHKIVLGTLLGLTVMTVIAIAVSPAPEDSGTKTASAKATETPFKSAFDRPTEAERAKLLAGLVKIDPRMADKPDRYVDRSINTCSKVQANDLSDAKLVDVTVMRFEGGTMPDFSEDQARKVLSLVKSTFCDAK